MHAAGRVTNSHGSDTLFFMSDVEIDGLRLPMEAPATVDALAARVAELNAAGQAVYPVGGGTGLDYGAPPSQPGVALSTQLLHRVVDYPVRDLTVTVQAGMKVGELQSLLAAEKQRLPVEAAHANQATVGGAISANVFGPRRLSSGTFRDQIIGMTVANDEGELCTAGGRVVKNVAGYDLCKLYAGALGTLGVIVQVTFKLQPLPPAFTWLVAPVAAQQLAATLDQIHASATRPAAVEVLNGAAAAAFHPALPAGDFVLAVLFEDNDEAVAWQSRQIQNELAVPLAQPTDATAFERQLIDSPAVDGCAFAVLATTRPSAVAEYLLQLNVAPLRLHAHAMSGVVRLGIVDAEVDRATKIHRSALEESGKAGGNAVVRRCPTKWKAHLGVWGHQPKSLDIMRQVRQQFDPRNLLNPGRFG